ncbi:hypothetical protein YC2023_033118 [Brassica napus]
MGRTMLENCRWQSQHFDLREDRSRKAISKRKTRSTRREQDPEYLEIVEEPS